MKIKDNFVLREVFGKPTVFSTGSFATKKPLTIELNNTAVFLWNLLCTDKSQIELENALMCEYNVDNLTAKNSVEYVLNTMKVVDCIE